MYYYWCRVFCVGKFRRFWGVPFRRIFEFSKVKVLFWGKWVIRVLKLKFKYSYYSIWLDLDVEAILEEMVDTIGLVSIRRWIWYGWIFHKIQKTELPFPVMSPDLSIFESGWKWRKSIGVFCVALFRRF